MNKEVLYVLLPDYAAHEMVYLSEAIASDEFALKENPKYVNKVVAPTLEPVKSIGGFRVIPDYSFDTMPEDYAALVLIGGFGWTAPVAEKVAPIVSKAIEIWHLVMFIRLFRQRPSTVLRIRLQLCTAESFTRLLNT